MPLFVDVIPNGLAAFVMSGMATASRQLTVKDEARLAGSS
jgi:hypothetical protein